MKTLRTYLFRQIITSLLMTMAVFTFVLLLGNVFKEILAPLIQRQVTAGLAVQAVGLLIPFVWVFALPMAMLTATLLVFGRFSADQELTAARASGISLLSLVSPIFLFSILLCGISALVNLEIAPLCRVAYKDLLFKLSVELSSNFQLPEERFNKEFKGYVIYVGKKSKSGQELEDVILTQNTTNGSTTVHASRGLLQVDVPNRQIILELFDVRGVDMKQSHGIPGVAARMPFTLPFPNQAEKKSKPKISEMTLWELLDEMRDLEQRVLSSPSPAGALTNSTSNSRADRERQVKALTSPIRVQLHRLVATSFACFGFTLVGIPLGIRVHRRETNVSFLIALVLVVIYYGLVLTGQSLETRPDWNPHLVMWLPNLIFQGVGVALLWRANRGL